MAYEVEGVIPGGIAKKTWSELTVKRLSDPPNMQGRSYEPQKIEKVNYWLLVKDDMQ